MPQQLIYTSAPRGVVAGRSGHCTVARSAAMREALMLQLEKFSYYQHLSLSGGQERPIYSCRVVDIRGSRFHVLSRIQDAGLDFTGRTNFLAHHVVFTPEEIRQFPSPPVILRSWSGWVKSWTNEPQLFENEEWSGLPGLVTGAAVPATKWQQVTGDATNGYGMLDARAGIAFRVDNLTEDQILALFAESLELLELRDPRRDHRATSWQYTFTTSMQEQDNPSDFRWRCLHSDNPASSRFAGPDCRPLSDVRALRVTNEEALLARSGRQPPRFVVQPQNVRCTEGETARLNGKAEGVPAPRYQWFVLDRAGNGQIVANGNSPELLLPNATRGMTRYVLRATNSQGDVTSDVATLSAEPKLRLATKVTASANDEPAIRVEPKIDYEREFDSLNNQYGNNQAAQKGKFGLRWIIPAFVAVAFLVVGSFMYLKRDQSPHPAEDPRQTLTNNSVVAPAVSSTNQNDGPTNGLTITNTPPEPSAQPKPKDTDSDSATDSKALQKQELKPVTERSNTNAGTWNAGQVIQPRSNNLK